MKPYKSILFTFDYELFLGKRSGTVSKCLLIPTERVLSILEQEHAKCIFFVDTLYLFRLEEIAEKYENAYKDKENIDKQIRQIVTHGHYVFPHIHPHWLDAVYLPDINQWDLSDIRKYRFHALTQQQRSFVFQKSFQILEKIMTVEKMTEKKHLIDSFRAGGWCIQPFEDFKPFFQQYGIKNDFSVLRGMKDTSSVRYYDFTRIPQKNIYHFEDDVVVENEQGQFTEYTISHIYISLLHRFFNRIWLKYLWKTGNRSIGDGISIISYPVQEKNQHYIMAAIELLNAATLPSFILYLKKNNYLHFITHPKMLSDHNIRTLEKF